MWEKLVNCIKGKSGSQRTSCQFVQLADLMKQVPPNQLHMFEMFAKKNEEYKERVRKYPESMPTIDWEYYRKNVREEFVEWVKGYETKYDKLHSLFENRDAMVDHKRYFDRVDEETVEVKKAISAYKAESNERIKQLTEKLQFVNGMLPYDQMTMEEFCFARPHLAPDFINKPTFWPHTPEEQTPGPADPEAAAALHEDHEPEPPKKPTPEQPPEKVKTEAAVAPKKPSEPLVETSQLAEKASELAKDVMAKAIILFNALKEKIAGLANKVKEKADATKKARAEAAKDCESPTATDTTTPTKTLDSFKERDSGPNICTQTIIRGEEEANPEIKERHSKLSVEAECEEAREQKASRIARALERKRQMHEAEDWPHKRREDPCKPKEDPCKPKYDPCKPEEDPCKPKTEEIVCKPDPCKQMEQEAICEPDPCKPKKKEPVCDPCELLKKEDECKPDPCKPKEEKPVCETEKDSCKEKGKKDDKCMDSKNKGEDEKDPEQTFINISQCSEELAKKEAEKSGDPGKPKEKASLTDINQESSQKPILGMQTTESKDAKMDQKSIIEGAKEVGPVYTDPNQLEKLLDKEKEVREKKELKKKESADKVEEIVKPKDDKPVTIYPKLEISTKPKTKVPDDTNNSPTEMAKQVFNMATGAASLLTEATNTLEDLKKKKEDRLEALEQAYTSAQRQAQGALAEASKAVEAANKLAKKSAQQTGEISSQDQEALDMAEKHAILAKMLASRAVALKDQLARVLNDLKKKE
ncbi:proteoglycan 4 [Drosophila ficusphila]|uniref:proteoglycan 4 n=1 Tax=Drosophila ficusphila TaxID=30025 RepID=UPI0007E78040|nr:proteoglycan 4 [Drosophila ficusphila]